MYHNVSFPFQKIRPDSEVPEVREKTNSEVPNTSVTVTNNSDLNDSREINFEYLKHVVLKFMSCRESEVKMYAYLSSLFFSRNWHLLGILLCQFHTFALKK